MTRFKKTGMRSRTIGEADRLCNATLLIRSRVWATQHIFWAVQNQVPLTLLVRLPLLRIR